MQLRFEIDWLVFSHLSISVCQLSQLFSSSFAKITVTSPPSELPTCQELTTHSPVYSLSGLTSPILTGVVVSSHTHFAIAHPHFVQHHYILLVLLFSQHKLIGRH